VTDKYNFAVTTANCVDLFAVWCKFILEIRVFLSDLSKLKKTLLMFQCHTRTIRYDTIEEINVDSKAEYTA